MEYSRQWEIKGFEAPPPHFRLLKVLMSPATHSVKNVAIGMTLLPSGSTSSLHSHSVEEEIWYVVSGRGSAIVGDEKIPIEADILIYVPPLKKHQLINEADETLKVLWVFSPPGPEREFVTLKTK